MGLVRLANLYAYVRNNPAMREDSTGYFEEEDYPLTFDAGTQQPFDTLSQSVGAGTALFGLSGLQLDPGIVGRLVILLPPISFPDVPPGVATIGVASPTLASVPTPTAVDCGPAALGLPAWWCTNNSQYDDEGQLKDYYDWAVWHSSGGWSRPLPFYNWGERTLWRGPGIYEASDALP